MQIDEANFKQKNHHVRLEPAGRLILSSGRRTPCLREDVCEDVHVDVGYLCLAGQDRGAPVSSPVNLPGTSKPFQSEVAPATYQWLKRAAAPAHRWVRAVIALGLAETGLTLVIGWTVAAVVEHSMFGQLPTGELTGWFAIASAAWAGRVALRWFRDRFSFSAGAALCDHARELLWSDTACWQEVSSESRLSVLEQVEALHDYGARYLPERALAVAGPLVILAAVASQSWFAALLLLVTGPTIPLFAWLIATGAARASRDQFTALGTLGALFLDRLQGLTTLRLLNRASSEGETIDRAARDYRRRAMKVLRLVFLSTAMVELLSSIGIGMMAVYLGLSLLGWSFGFWVESPTYGQALFLLIVAADFFAPLRNMGRLNHARVAALGASEHLAALVASPARPLNAPRGGAVLRDTARVTEAPEILFDGVSAAWTDCPHHGPPDDRGDGADGAPVLRDASFRIRAGERVALVGPSGSGKTTTLALLLGLLSPRGGRIMVDGHDLAQMDPKGWLQRVAWVGQNPYLFHGTVRSNILLGNPGADDALVSRAARLAGVDAFCAQWPTGLDTPVGEDGQGLSGGQVQRVALARALVRPGGLMVLDEPTAHLDWDTKGLVLDGLRDAAQGRTLVMVTHHVDARLPVDRVLRVADGQVLDVSRDSSRREEACTPPVQEKD
jgi:ATP-binding cassette subfamily C protein CydD